MVTGGQKFCVCEGFWRLWVVGFPPNLDAGKNKGVKIKEVKGRGCSAPGRMKKNTNPAQDRWGGQEKWNHSPFQAQQKQETCCGDEQEQSREREKRLSSSLCTSNGSPEASAPFSLGTREMGKETLPNKVGETQGDTDHLWFMGGKRD